MASFKDQIDPANLPRHVAVIMDGNGRWAKKKGAARLFGHSNAVKAVREVTEGCGELGVQYLTLYAFSTENWGRPKEEVDGLMNLLVRTLNDEIKTLMENNVRLTIIGDSSHLPRDCRTNLESALQMSTGNTGLNLILALSYSGRWEILEAVRKIGNDIRQGLIDPRSLTEEIFEGYLQTSGIPDPELLIRTSGEQRLSNFLLWQVAYTELFITPTLWPDFRKEDLYEAIYAFQHRERRFGKTSDQLNPVH